jgi:hypothetical protein
VVSFEVDPKTRQIKFIIEESVFITPIERILKLTQMKMLGCTIQNERNKEFYRIEFDKSIQSLTFKSNFKHLAQCTMPLQQLFQNEDFALFYTEYQRVNPPIDPQNEKRSKGGKTLVRYRQVATVKKPASTIPGNNKIQLPSDNVDNKMESTSHSTSSNRPRPAGNLPLNELKICPRCKNNLVLTPYGTFRCPHCSFQEEDDARNPILDPVKVSKAAWTAVYRNRGG